MKRIRDTHLKGHALHKLMGLGIVDDETSQSGQERSFSDESFPSIPGHKVEALIGTGGMGRVYRARQLKTDRLVAVKVLNPGLLSSLSALRRFKQEIESVARLSHPHIMQIFESGDSGGLPWFSMRWVPGGDLSSLPLPMDPREAAGMMIRVAKAVHHSHSHGMLHRDLKPSNILVDEASGPIVADFGLAKQIDGGEAITLTGAWMGTPQYMAPEQIETPNSQLTTGCDIYSLGSVFFELLTGLPPFSGTSPMEVARKVVDQEAPSLSAKHPELGRDLDMICRKSLEKDPADRYSSAMEWADDLQRYLDGDPVSVRPISSVERVSRWARRKPLLATFASLVLLMFLLGIVTIFLLWQSASHIADLERTQRQEAEAATEALWGAASAAARAAVMDGDIGSKDRALEAIQSASQHRVTLSLRNQAIAAWSQTGLSLVSQRAFSKDLVDVAYDPDLGLCALLDKEYRVRLVALESGDELAAWDESIPKADRIEFVPGSHYLCVQWFEGYVFELRDVFTGERVWRVPRALVDRFALQAREGVVAIGTMQSSIRFFNLNEKKELPSITLERDTRCLRFHPTQPLLAAFCGEEIHLLDLESGEVSSRIQTPSGFSLSWSPDGSVLAAGTDDGTIVLHHLASGRQRTLMGHQDKVWQLDFHPTQPLLTSSSYDGSMRLWDAHEGKTIIDTDQGYGGRFSSDGKYLGFGGANHVFGMFEVSPPELRKSFVSPLGPSKGIRFADVHTENAWVCSVTQDGVTVHDYETKESFIHLDVPSARAAFFTPKGNELMVVDNTHVRWFSLPKDEYIGKGIQAHAPRNNPDNAVTQTRVIRAGSFTFCQAADLSDDGHYLAMMGSDKNYRDMTMVLNLETEKPVRVFPRIFGFISVDISPDNQRVAVGSFNGNASRVWDLGSGKELIRISSGNGELVFNSNGSLLADANFNQTDIYRTSDWQLQESIDRESFSDMPGLLAFSTDGKIVARTTSMRRIELLGVGSWELLASFTLPHPSVISFLNFSPDGRYLVAGTRSSVLHLLNVEQMEKNLRTLGLEWSVE